MKPAGSEAPSWNTGAASTTPIGPFSRSSGSGSEATGLPLAIAFASIGPTTE